MGRGHEMGQQHRYPSEAVAAAGANNHNNTSRMLLQQKQQQQQFCGGGGGGPAMSSSSSSLGQQQQQIGGNSQSVYGKSKSYAAGEAAGRSFGFQGASAGHGGRQLGQTCSEENVGAIRVRRSELGGGLVPDWTETETTTTSRSVTNKGSHVQTSRRGSTKQSSDSTPKVSDPIRRMRDCEIASIVPVNDAKKMTTRHWAEFNQLELSYLPIDKSPTRGSPILGRRQSHINREFRHKVVKWMSDACETFAWTSQTFFTAVHAWDSYILKVPVEIEGDLMPKLSAACLYFGAQLVESAADENVKTLDEFCGLCHQIKTSVAVREVQAHLVEVLQGISLVRRTPVDFLLMYLAQLQIAPSPCPEIYVQLLEKELLSIAWDLALGTCIAIYSNGVVLDGLPGSRWVAGALTRVLELASDEFKNNAAVRDLVREKVYHFDHGIDQYTDQVDMILRPVWETIMIVYNEQGASATDPSKGVLSKKRRAYNQIRHSTLPNFFDERGARGVCQPSAETVRKLSGTIRSLTSTHTHTPPTISSAVTGSAALSVGPSSAAKQNNVVLNQPGGRRRLSVGQSMAGGGRSAVNGGGQRDNMVAAEGCGGNGTSWGQNGGASVKQQQQLPARDTNEIQPRRTNRLSDLHHQERRPSLAGRQPSENGHQISQQQHPAGGEPIANRNSTSTHANNALIAAGNNFNNPQKNSTGAAGKTDENVGVVRRNGAAGGLGFRKSMSDAADDNFDGINNINSIMESKIQKDLIIRNMLQTTNGAGGNSNRPSVGFSDSTTAADRDSEINDMSGVGFSMLRNENEDITHHNNTANTISNRINGAGYQQHQYNGTEPCGMALDGDDADGAAPFFSNDAQDGRDDQEKDFIAAEPRIGARVQTNKLKDVLLRQVPEVNRQQFPEGAKWLGTGIAATRTTPAYPTTIF